ncbi:hypothetical protein DY000_02020559 [Brassica cretica]|uniref:Uncharacterized protein n=1 Tax=Brassica cretica TaxID=69181 RepID=A0ABQ7E5I2_BRACR|nr:hypothetical protein DY000_02020559 [Brassica cretica]
MNTVRVIKALVRRKLSDDLLAISEPHGLWVLGFPGPLGFLDSWLIPYGLDPRIAWGIGGFRTQRLFLRKPWVLDPEATRLSAPVGISYSAARKLAIIEFPCCTVLLQEATIRLRGCWYG